MPASEVVRQYLRDFRALLLASPHAPSPATVAILNWLIVNVPESNVRPCLIHGDIGFHNILLDAGRLSIIVDWERAHIGHPAEDLAYLHNAAAKDLDWDRLMAAYRKAGGPQLHESDLLFFRIMMLARNAISLNIGPSRLFNGEVSYVKLLVAEYYMLPQTLKSIAALIESYPAARPA
jgi:aminoglycoside phosphotransferase (APT) family kinase protein